MDYHGELLGLIMNINLSIVVICCLFRPTNRLLRKKKRNRELLICWGKRENCWDMPRHMRMCIHPSPPSILLKGVVHEGKQHENSGSSTIILHKGSCSHAQAPFEPTPFVASALHAIYKFMILHKS